MERVDEQRASHMELERLSPVQQLLTDLYAAYLAKSGKRKVSDNVFARWLGVSPSNWNYWINGSRLPELKNALLLAPKIEQLLGSEARVQFMSLLGEPNYQQIRDPQLQEIVSHWDEFSREVKEQIRGIIVEDAEWRAAERKGGR